MTECEETLAHHLCHRSLRQIYPSHGRNFAVGYEEMVPVNRKPARLRKLCVMHVAIDNVLIAAPCERHYLTILQIASTFYTDLY